MPARPLTRAEVEATLEMLANAAAGCNGELVQMCDWDIMGAIDARDARIAELEGLVIAAMHAGWSAALEAAAKAAMRRSASETCPCDGCVQARDAAHRIRGLKP